jgi:predicted metalloprotease
MRITRGYRSDNVEDRRAQGASGGGFGGGGGVNLLFMLFQRFGIPGVLIGGVLLYFSGGLGGGSSGLTSPAASPESLAEEQPLVELVSFVFDDAQATWSELFAKSGKQYRPAKLVLFRGSTRSGCGVGQAAMGPFYCPADGNAYIDLGFYQELRQRLGAPGDFAQAYVIAHELGHHVQSLLGESERVHRAPESQQAGERGLLVRLELQADCYAGIWAHYARDRLTEQDIDDALTAASAVGDDMIQKKTQGYVVPESFTHGSAEQRRTWFARGFGSGQVSSCDTFAARSL